MVDPAITVSAWFKDNPELRTEFLVRAKEDLSDAEDWFFDWADSQLRLNPLYRLVKDLLMDTVDYYWVFLEVETD
jgi:hypothetical protein